MTPMSLQQQHPAAPPAAAILSDILCGVNGSRQAYEAVRQAAWLAGPEGRLELLAITAVRGAGGAYRHAALGPARAQEVLGRAERIAEEAGVPAVTAIDERSPVAEVLLERAAGHGLLAIGPPSLARIVHLVVGGTATTAAHLLPTSLLVARKLPGRTPFGARILVASDGLERSDQLVDFAAELALRHGSSLTFLHAMRSEETHHPTRVAGQVERVTTLLGERATVRIEPSHRHELIVEAAEDCSLIIVGSRRLGGARALGSVSERVVHDAPCSVLVIRPEDLQPAG